MSHTYPGGQSQVLELLTAVTTITKQNQGARAKLLSKGERKYCQTGGQQQLDETFSGKFPCGLSFESSRVPQIAGKHEQKDTQSN